MRTLVATVMMFLSVANAEPYPTAQIFPGYVTHIKCNGKLLLSAVGNEQLVRLEALPKETGCGVLIKPMGPVGQTNLILETTSGTLELLVEIAPVKKAPRKSDLNISLGGAE